MKRIEAIVRPHKIDDLKAALSALGVRGLTVHEVRGAGRTGGKREVYRGSAYVVDFVAKIKLELITPDEMVDDVIQAICATARTDKIGDGKIFVSDVDGAIRIRTGERDEEAL